MSYILVFDGDSIALGVGATHGFTLADQTLPLIPVEIEHHVTAVGGRQAKECLALFNINIVPLYQSQAERNIIFFCAGDNDIDRGSSARETYDAIIAYVELAHQNDWRVIVSTKLQRYDWPNTARAIITELNSLIIENAANADGVADFQGDSIMGSVLGRIDQAYYTVDQVHPADSGYAILASIAAAALLKNSVL